MKVKIRNIVTEKEAIQFTDDNVHEIINFMDGKGSFHYEHKEIGVLTLEGYKPVPKGYWVIKGIKGEFYPCAPDVFEKSYEIIKED